MEYSTYRLIYANKAKGYPINACRRAIEDCHETLKLWGEGISTEYSARLWAEIDAMRERIAYLQRKHN